MDNPLIIYLQSLHSITEQEKKMIDASFEYRSVKEGDYLYRGEKICHELFFICKGVLKIVKTNDKGVALTHFFLKENQFCTILHSFDNELTAEESIMAACDADVMVITRKKLLTLYEQLPYMQELINRITQQRLLDKIQTRNNYLGKDAATRYQLFVTQQADIALRVSLGDIASYLEITPQSLSRIRKGMLDNR